MRDGGVARPPRRRGGLLNAATLVAATMFLAAGLSDGAAYYSFGVFVSPLRDEFGWSVTQINVAVSLAVVVGIGNPVAGWLLDRLGARPVVVGSLLLMAAGFGLRPFMSDLWHFYALNCLVYLGVPGATELPMARLVSVWFPRRRGRMMGLIATGPNVGGLTMVPLAAALVLASGWALGYAVFGALFVAAALLALLWIRDAPGGRDEAAGAAPARNAREEQHRLPGLTFREALRTRTFYLLAVASFATMFPTAAVLPQLVPHLEREGLASGTAAAVVSVTAFFSIGSKLAFGTLAEAITARRALALSATVVSVGTVALVLAGGSGLVWPAAALWGFGFAAPGALVPLAVAEAFGLREYGSILGVIRMFGTLSFVAAPVAVGMMFEASGSYELPFLLSVIAVAPAVPATLLARPSVSSASPR